MAPIAQPPARKDSYDGSKPRFESLQKWIDVYGTAEYITYKRSTAAPHLSYEDWTASDHVLGPYLWHTTLDVWDEESSSDEELDLDAPNVVSRGPLEPKPKRRVTPNGHGKRKPVKSSTSTPRENSDGPGGSAKRRRRPRKKYLSEEIVASDDSDDIDEPTTVTEIVSPVAFTLSAAANGRRKSGGRRKKTFLSEETISPEDEEDDPMSIDDVAAAANGAAAPSVPAKERHTPVAATKAISPKAKLGRKPKKKYLSAETVPLDDDEDSAPADVATPSTTAASPENPDNSASSRRGLRIRTPAQQRPYLHTARLFEEQLSAKQEPEASIKRSPKAKTTKLAQVSYPDDGDEDEMLFGDDYDTIVVEPEESERKAHYKGKGRAWKKTEEDEDQDYVSPVKLKNSNQPKRKLGRRKYTQVSEPVIQDDDQDEVEEQPVEAEEVKEVAAPSPAQKAKQKRRPRKPHHLSEEFVRDESDTEEVEEHQEQEQEPEPKSPSPVQKPATPKGRSRKSDQSTTSRGTIDINDDDESFISGYKNSTPQSKPTRKTRGSIVSLTETPEKASDDVEPEDDTGLVSPLRKIRKRKSLGSDGGRS